MKQWNGWLFVLLPPFAPLPNSSHLIQSRRLSPMKFLCISLFLPLLVSLPVEDSSPLTSLDFINAVSVSTDRPMGHVLLSDQHFRLSRAKRGAVVTLEKDKWPGGRVPYILSAAYSVGQRAVFARAIAAYSSRTCIRFVPKLPTDNDYIVISKLDGCYADFARVGGRQQVSLADECIDYATIVHEFMHVIGFIHEHQREDRDSFVKILWPNVLPGANTDFDKLTGLGLSYYGEQYDYFSLMHYESNEGSRNGRNTIEATNPSYTPLMGKSTDFSRSDLNRINRAYQCHSFFNGISRKLPIRKVWKGVNRAAPRFPNRRG